MVVPCSDSLVGFAEELAELEAFRFAVVIGIAPLQSVSIVDLRVRGSLLIRGVNSEGVLL